MGIPLEPAQVTSSDKAEPAVLSTAKKTRGQQRSGGRLGTDAIGFYLSSI